MKPVVRLMSWLVALPTACLSLSGCYVLKQGVGQAHLLMARKPVSAVLADPYAPNDVRVKLRFIEAVKTYAENVIGLKHSNNYQSYVQLDRDAVSYVVSAAPKDRLEAYTWWFPIIGAVPYKGFFDKNDAISFRKQLDDQGFDTILRGVPAFSTLGWLPDPVYSPFLQYDEPTLADIIIHELTHVTLFLPGQASFNEGFATFVGDTGAQAFLKARYGEDSDAYREAVASVADNALFTRFVQEVSARLETLYHSNESRDQKIKDRAPIFAWARSTFETDYLPKMRTRQFRHFPQSTFNNAALISYRTYYNRLDRFQAAYERQGRDLRKTVLFFKDVVAKAPDPEKYLDQYLARKPQDSSE